MNSYLTLSEYVSRNLSKLLLIMQFCMIIIFLGIMQVNAHTYGQQLTLHRTHIKVREVFKAIKKQTGYDIVWRPETLDPDRKINANYQRTSLQNVIVDCILGLNLTFVIQDRTIVIKPIVGQILYPVQQDTVIFKGIITSETGNPLVGATVRNIGGKTTFTNSRGEFAIYAPSKGILEISFVGYITKQLTLNGIDHLKSIEITMNPGNNTLGEVNVVSTGYQDISRERVTGSFEVITKEQLQHSSDPNIIKRLEGITTSMNFNNNLIPINSASTTTASTNLSQSPLANLTIRGRNTLNPNQLSYGNQSGAVLVVIDGIASPYPIDNINPDDIENLTILKDAAAASIWGSRAANGVIVVKTKRGMFKKPISINFNSNFNFGEKPNLFYNRIMSTSDYIDAQIYQFNVSAPNVDVPNLNSPQPFLSTVAEILGQQKNGIITSAQSRIAIDALRNNDLRKDFDKYVIRNTLIQNYALGIEGGSKDLSSRLSVAYNRNIGNSIAANDSRLAIGYSSSYRPFKQLEVNGIINYTVRHTNNQAPQNFLAASLDAPFYPYSRLVDDNGNPIAIPYRYRPAFIQLLANTYGSKIQDLTYNPIQNIGEGVYKTIYKDLNFNIGANYKITSDLAANVIYAFGIGNNTEDILFRKNSYYARNLVSYFTSPLGEQSIPNGGIDRIVTNDSRSHSLRGQLNFNKNWNKNDLTTIGGVEVTQNYVKSQPFLFYGYDEETLSINNQLNYKNLVPTLFDTGFGGVDFIPYTSPSFQDIKVRTYSLYANSAYTFNSTYTISGSIRKDMSSVFGVGTNKGGTPFFSLGGKWNIANERFYRFALLPILQLRATFGYNGNVNPVVSARQIISYSLGVQNNGLTSASTVSGSATNPLLRPEKTGMINLGLDFGFKNKRISGSLEYYDKKTTDLIAGNSIDPSSGFNNLSYNTANLHGWGTDFTLNTLNVQLRKFSWSSTVLFSYNRVKVTKLFTASARSASNVVFGTPTYNLGSDLSRIYAYVWGGLDPLSGNPRGIINGQPVVINNAASYNSVVSQPLNTARYFGSAVPVYYGSLRNTVKYGAFTASANILFKLGYYFRRPQSELVRYSQFFRSNTIQGAEYSRRWKQPGDELKTTVPSLIFPADQNRDLFYQFSEINVNKADHARLQEINFSYGINKKNWRLKNMQFYVNISNLGIIWRANKVGLDPDISDYPSPRTYALGLNANF